MATLDEINAKLDRILTLLDGGHSAAVQIKPSYIEVNQDEFVHQIHAVAVGTRLRIDWPPQANVPPDGQVLTYKSPETQQRTRAKVNGMTESGKIELEVVSRG